MERFRHILAAIDLGREAAGATPGSRRAIRRAIWLARHVGGSLTLLHSSHDDEYWDDDALGFVHATGTEERRREALDAAVRDLEEQGAPTPRLVESSESAWRAIVQEVLRSDVDVVVAGKRTDVHTDARKLGSIARNLLRYCPCAVWLEDPRQHEDPSVILAATDLSVVGDRAVALAAAVAAALGAELHVVHAYSLSVEAQFEGGEGRRAYEQRKRDAAREQIERVLADAGGGAKAKLHIGLTSPTQAVLQGAAALDAGLVVMGTVSRGGIPGFVMGNTAERLVDRIDCALLTVKPDDFVCSVTAE